MTHLADSELIWLSLGVSHSNFLLLRHSFVLKNLVAVGEVVCHTVVVDCELESICGSFIAEVCLCYFKRSYLSFC